MGKVCVLVLTQEAYALVLTHFTLPGLPKKKDQSMNLIFLVVGFLLVIASGIGNQLDDHRAQAQGVVESLFCPKGTIIQGE